MTTITLALDEAPAIDEVRQVTVAGRAPIAIYNLDGDYFATDDTCTHGDASLAEGDIEGDEIVCPFHNGAFDIRTGQATVAPCADALRCYAVQITGDKLSIDLSE